MHFSPQEAGLSWRWVPFGKIGHEDGVRMLMLQGVGTQGDTLQE